MEDGKSVPDCPGVSVAYHQCVRGRCHPGAIYEMHTKVVLEKGKFKIWSQSRALQRTTERRAVLYL